MDKLVNRQYHEILNYMDLDIPKNVKYGNELLDRIPFFNNDDIDKNDNKLNIEDLMSKLNFNLPNDKFKFMEKYFIERQDHIGLSELLKEHPPYNKIEARLLYYYCRELVGNPVKKIEQKRIQQDLKAHKKASMKQTEQKITFEKRNADIDFY
jgi:hypothetical protein